MDSETLLLSITGLVGLIVFAAAMLRGWQGWLTLKTRELERQVGASQTGDANGMARIEIADLKERIRKLEAIAAGVDL